MQLPLPYHRGQKKPWPSIPRINWAHPLTRGLVTYVYDCGGGAGIDLVTGSVGKRVGTTTVGVTTTSRVGQGTLWADVNSANTLGQGMAFGTSPLNDNIANALPYSFSCGFFPTSSTQGDGSGGGVPFCICDGSGSQNTPIAVATGTGATTTQTFAEFSNANSINAGNWVLNAWNVCTGVANSAGEKGYLNAAAAVTNALTTTFSSTGFKPMVNGQNFNTTGAAFSNLYNGYVFFGAAWKLRALTAAEHLQLYLDPWCFLIYPEDEIFAELVGAASTPALVAPPFVLGGRIGALGFDGMRVHVPPAALSQILALVGAGSAMAQGRAGATGKTPLSGQGNAQAFGRLAFAGKTALAANAKGQSSGALGPFTGKAALLATGLAAAFGKISFAGTTALSAKGIGASFGKGSIGFFAFLQGRGTAMANGTLQFAGTAAFAARGSAMAKGMLQFAGTSALSAKGAAASFGKGTIGFFAFLQGRGASMARGAAQFAGTTGLAAKGAAGAKGALQLGGATALAARGTASSFARGLVTAGLPLFAKGFAASFGRSNFASAAALAAQGAAKSFARGLITVSGGSTVALAALGAALSFARSVITVSQPAVPIPPPPAGGGGGGGGEWIYEEPRRTEPKKKRKKKDELAPTPEAVMGPTPQIRARVIATPEPLPMPPGLADLDGDRIAKLMLEQQEKKLETQMEAERAYYEAIALLLLIS